MKKIFPLSAIFLLPFFLFAQSQRYYVDQLAFGQNNGQSWTDAFQNLHDALALAEAGDEIWVAKGIYRPSTTNDRAARFQLLSGVRLYGSFAGTELDLTERDWTATTTVLDGNIGNPEDSTDNTYNLLYLYRPDSLTIIDGFAFSHAVANDSLALPGEPGVSGAALYIMAFDGEAYPTIRHCIFEGNTALQHGGAVYVEGGGSGSVAPVFEQCYFTNNHAIKGNGGALYRNGGSWVDRPADIEGCVFEKNSAYRYGGAIFFTDSPRSDTFDIRNTTMRSNRLTTTLFNLSSEGTAIQLNLPRPNGATILSLRGCEISDHPHPVNSRGSAIGLSISFNFELGNLILDIDSCTFKRNYGIASIENEGWFQSLVKNSYFQEDTLAIVNSSIFNISYKSVLYNVTIDRCRNFELDGVYKQIDNIFWLNCSDPNQILNYNPDPVNVTHLVTHNTYLLYNGRSDTKISNSTLNGNTTVNNKKTEFSNNIISLSDSNSFFYIFPSDSAHVFHHNIINRPDTLLFSDSWIKTNNLWATDPQFMQPDSGDFRLQPCSPAREAGTNTAVFTATDAAGQPRIQGGTVDMGAYEAPAFGLTAAPTIKPTCDSTSNGSITAPLVGVCAPLTVAWQAGNQTGTTLTNLAAGLYHITLSDAQGRNLAFEANVPIAYPPVLYGQDSPISCFGAADGTLSVKPVSGQAPFTYQWSPPVSMDSIATGLGINPASVTVTDAWGCVSSFDFPGLQQPDTLQFTAIVQDATGPQSADGSIVVNTVMGGTGPYHYRWADGSTENSLPNLLPGLYTVTVTDQRGCEAVWTFEVDFVSGTKETTALATLSIYPNPAADWATVAGDFPNSTPSAIALYDATGRLVRTWTVPKDGSGVVLLLPLAGLTKGEYVVQMKDAQGRIIGLGRLVKG